MADWMLDDETARDPRAIDPRLGLAAIGALDAPSAPPVVQRPSGPGLSALTAERAAPAPLQAPEWMRAPTQSSTTVPPGAAGPSGFIQAQPLVRPSTQEPTPSPSLQQVAQPQAPQAPRIQTLDDAKRAVDAHFTGDFMAGVKSGWEQTKGLGALAVSALGQKASELTDGAIGDGMQKWGYETYQQTERAAEPYREGRTTRVEDIDGVGSAVDWFQYTLGNVAPSVAESILAGGIGFAAGSAATPAGSILGAVGGAAGKGAIKSLLANVAKKGMARGMSREAAEKMAGGAAGAAIGTFAAGYQMGTGDIYGETIDPATGKGNATVALLGAIPYAGVEALTDMMLAGHILKGAAGADLIKRIPAAFAKGAGLEGSQEVAQESINILAGLNEGKEYSTEEVVSRLGNAFAAGAVAGGVLGGAGGIRRDTNAGKSETDLLMDRALDDGPISGFADPQALRDAALNPQTDEVTRASALAAVESQLRARDPILAEMWRKASVESIAGKRSVAETLAEIQSRMAQTPATPPADITSQEAPQCTADPTDSRRSDKTFAAH
jgi:hypothetical protein